MKPTAPREDKPALGIGLALAAFFLFAMTDISAKTLVTASVPVLIVAFVRYAVNFLLVLGYFLPRDGLDALKSNVPHLQLLRGVTLLASTVLNFWALQHLPLTTTIPIFFAIPLIVCLLSVPMLGETVGLRRYIAVIVGFIGVLIIIRPGGLVFQWAMLISIGSTIAASLYFISTRMVAGRDNMPVSQIYATGFATICLLPFAISGWSSPPEPYLWAVLFAAGAFAGLGHCLLTIAYRYQEASKIAPLVYSEIIYITGFSWLLFNDLPDFWTIVGTAIIIASGIYVWVRERQQNLTPSVVGAPRATVATVAPGEAGPDQKL